MFIRAFPVNIENNTEKTVKRSAKFVRRSSAQTKWIMPIKHVSCMSESCVHMQTWNVFKTWVALLRGCVHLGCVHARACRVSLTQT